MKTNSPTLEPLRKLRQDRAELSEQIKQLLCKFEEKYGEDMIMGVHYERNNPENDYQGKITDVEIRLSI